MVVIFRVSQILLQNLHKYFNIHICGRVGKQDLNTQSQPRSLGFFEVEDASFKKIWSFFEAEGCIKIMETKKSRRSMEY